MAEIGLEVPKAEIAHTLEEALEKQPNIGFPTIIRPSFTMGGSGGGIAYNREEFEQIVAHGLEMSPTTEVLLEESVIGWKEFEMEVVRDRNDNCIIVCSIENLDPMGVHTGDSITVAPAQTLTDKEYQRLRDASIEVLRKIGVETGGSNVQFAICPETGRVLIIEMNPRVSRSSALASKATGFPIAKIAAKLAVGYTLDELKNEITGGADAGLVRADDRLRRYEDSALHVREIPGCQRPPDDADEIGRRSHGDRPQFPGVAAEGAARPGDRHHRTQRNLRADRDRRRIAIGCARNCACRAPIGCCMWRMHCGMATRIQDVAEVTGIDPWFVVQIADLVNTEDDIAAGGLRGARRRRACALSKRKGFSDARLAEMLAYREDAVRARRLELGVRPVYKRVDTCAAEFATTTAYLYSTYEEECEAEPTDRPKIMILGGGPNRIGQGIEFDYCCVHAALALKESGYETIMVNCNPETVSTDYDTSDRLYFESLTFEDVMEIIDKEKPEGRHRAVRRPDAAETGACARSSRARRLSAHRRTRSTWRRTASASRNWSKTLGLRQPPNRTARSKEEALHYGAEVGYPLIVRPSYVLGGRAMEVVHNDEDLAAYMDAAINVSNDSPVLLDRFLDLATEVDVDCICDGERRADRRHHGAHRAGRRAFGRFRVARCRRSSCPRRSRRNSRSRSSSWRRASRSSD